MAGAYSNVELRISDRATNPLKRINAATKRLAKSVGVTRAGVKALGASMATAFLPLIGITSVVSGLTAAFSTLSQQDFGEAKVQSLGTDSEELVKRLKLVTQELHGARSVAELTGAAYDVASAGFTEAADTAMVLKAASLGATGGFSDLNTVGNATTSVLNAYGKSAEEANLLVDQFIQTQNDGKIIVAEYAAGIGKVASVAAGLKVPLTEINAAMALATSTGVNAEVAFTGLKASLSRLAGPRAQKHFKRLGIEINAATLAQDGMLKTLKKLEGLDVGDQIAIFGQEAIQTMQPVLNNMERYAELIEKQEKAQGAAARAAFLANDTLNGSVKRLTVSIQNLFADGNEMGEILKLTIKAVAVSIETLGAAVKIVLAPIRAVGVAIAGIAKGWGIDMSGGMQKATENWFALMKALEVGLDKTFGFIEKLAVGIGKFAASITMPFDQAFADLDRRIKAFWEGLPEWMKWAVRQVTGVGEQIGQAVGGFFTETPEQKAKKKEKQEEIVLNERIKEQQREMKQLWTEIGQTIGESVHGAIKGLIKGTQTLSQALSNVLNKISDMLLDAGINMMLSGAFGGSSIGKFLGFGGKRAAGGPVSGGKSYVVGEKGPEVFVPGRSGTIVPNGAGGVNVSVNVDASGTSAEGDSDTSKELGTMLGMAIQQEIIKQKRPGGLLAVLP